MASNVEGGPRRGSSYRRPATGYPRGEQTRQRIIRAAVELFGNDGFDRISKRDIASRAGVRAPVLHYYFDGKEGLYLACVEHMQTHANRLLQPVIDSVRRRLAGPISRDGLIDCVCYIYDQTAEIFAREELDGGLRRQFHELLCGLWGRIIGKSPLYGVATGSEPGITGETPGQFPPPGHRLGRRKQARSACEEHRRLDRGAGRARP